MHVTEISIGLSRNFSALVLGRLTAHVDWLIKQKIKTKQKRVPLREKKGKDRKTAEKQKSQKLQTEIITL